MPRGVKYATEEERLAARRESKARYRASEEGKAAAKAYGKKWREANPERVKEKNDFWNERRKRGEYNPVYARQWYRNNRDRANAQNRAWQKAHPEKMAEYQRRRKARKMGSNPDLTIEQWQEILEEFDNCCAYCQAQGVKLEQEHMTPLVRGGRHTKSNVVPACRSCNARKSTKTLFEFASVG